MTTIDHTPVPLAEAAADFLSRKRIAVTGVSRNPSDNSANAIYKRLRDRGYDVTAINPNAEEVEGDPAFPNLASVPGGIEAVVIATAPERAAETVRECIDLGIDRIWMHRLFGAGSVADDAVDLGRRNGLVVIDGGCPLMFEPTSDGFHRFACKVGKLFGGVPRRV